VIGSSSVKQPPRFSALKCLSTGPLGVVKTLSQELAPEGITVNMVSPGRIDTDRVRTLDENRARQQSVSYEQFREQYEQTIPARRYGTPTNSGLWWRIWPARTPDTSPVRASWWMAEWYRRCKAR
jgi:3-oxoacyl-[acyl-carrier protein] reductase